MKKWQLALSGALVLIPAMGMPARAIFGLPDPVIDIGPERFTWIQQLEQNIAQAQSMKQQVDMGIKNITPTSFGWPTSVGGMLASEPILQNAAATLNQYRSIVRLQGGVPLPTDAATATAESGMSQLASEKADLASAQAASDSADGDLSAQQAGQRIGALQTSSNEKLREFLYAQQLQRSADEADAEAWMTEPLVTADDGE